MLMFDYSHGLLSTITDKQFINQLTFYNDELCIPPLFIHISPQ